MCSMYIPGLLKSDHAFWVENRHKSLFTDSLGFWSFSFRELPPPVIFAIGAWELFFKTMFLSKLVDAHFYRIGWEVWRSSLFSSELGFSEGRGKEGMLVIRIIYSRIRRKESCTNSRGGNADSIIFNYYSMKHVLAHPPFQMVTLQEKTHG